MQAPEHAERTSTAHGSVMHSTIGGASTNILPKMVYDCLDEDPLVPTCQQLQLADSTVVQPYRIAENVLIEFQDSLTLVDFMVMDIDPR
jgi:hypothetical protein